MVEEVIFETESVENRETVADYLRSVADKLDAGESITLSGAGQETSLSPPGTVTFEVKAERETGAAPELSVEFELEWTEGEAESGDGSLRIE